MEKLDKQPTTNINYDMDEKVLEYIKKILLKYNPIVEDRLDDLFSASEFDILLDMYKTYDSEYSCVCFMKGKEYARSSTLDSLESEGLFSLRLINKLIDFILSDHEIISEFYRTSNSIEFKFKVNIKEDTMKGISCGAIGLRLDFRGEKGIDMNPYIDSYFKNLVVNYFDKIKDTSFMEEEINRYVAGIKDKYLEGSSREDILNLLSKVPLRALKSAIYNMNAYTFMDALKEKINSEKQDDKTLSL